MAVTSSVGSQNAITLIARIWRLLSIRHRTILLLVTLLSIFQGFAITFPAVVVGSIVNRLLHPHVGSLTVPIVVLAALLVGFAVSRATAHIMLHRVLPQIEVTFRHLQVLQSLRTPLDETDKRYSAELNSLITTGTKATSDLVKISFGDLLPACVQAVWAIVLAFRVEWLVGCIMLIAAPLGYLIIRRQLRSQSGIRIKIQREKARLDGALTELLQGKAIVRSLNAVYQESERIRSDAQALADAEKQHHQAMGLFDASKSLIESAFGVGVVILSVWLATHHRLSPGGVLTLYLLYMQFANPLRDIHRMRDETSEAETQASIMFALLDTSIDPLFDRAVPTVACSEPPDAVAVDRISVRYPNQSQPILDNVTLTIPKGHFVGMCGPTGGGKSTLLKAMAGLTSIESGSLSILGLPLTTYNAESLAGAVAYASQRPYMIASTIRRNVTLGLADEHLVSDEEVADVLDRACIWDEVSAMPGGLDFQLGEGGAGISGGQGQRVVLARLLLRNPSVLLLDEATSALDNLREAAVMDSMEQLDATVVAVAHRLSTLRNADVIYVLDHGRIVQSGTFHDMRVSEGPFRDLLTATRSAPSRPPAVTNTPDPAAFQI